MSPVEEQIIPWPGPRPYDESEWKIFFGRTKEINDVRRRVIAHRLSILSGASGAGKTSLLRAGVVPLLRLQRYKIKEKGADTGQMEWPVLVLRDWGTAKGADIPQMIRSQMIEAAEALDRWDSERARVDREIITEVVESMSGDVDVLDIVQEICSRTEGLIIIFDQLEEILRAGEQTAKQITGIIRDLFESGLPIKLLLSLRIEHIADLRSLESLVGGLVARTLFLAPMGREGVKQVVQSVCRAANATMTPELIGQVLGWLAVAEEHRRRQISLDDAGDVGTTEDHPDLLALQAILYELFTIGATRSDTKLLINDDVVNDYREKHGVDQASIAAKALQRWITRALDWKSEKSINSGVVPEPALTRLIYRIAVRLAPHLSSGDYKVAQEQSDLFRKALGNEVWALGLRHPELRRMIRIVDKSTHLNTQDLGLSENFDEKGAGFLSGVALENEWSPSRTAHVLLGCYRETLGRLQRGNIIKPIFSPSGESVDQARSWELVHDRLGRAFADWAEEQRDTWEDCVASLVASRGISPIMITSKSRTDGVVSGSISHIRWEGCVVAPLEGRAFFRSVKFSSCHLRGSIFERCTFIGGEFLDCDLNGVLFRDCEFLADENGECLVVAQCNSASLGILYSRSVSLKFVGCTLTQFTLKNVDLEGAMAFEGTKVFLGYFGEVGAVGSQRWLSFDSTSGIYHCSGDVSSWMLLHLEPGCEQINSSPSLA